MAKRRNKDSTSSKKKTRKDEASPIPVTLLSGFLGAGKTTLLQYILTSKEHKRKIAVIVNDMAELNVDGQSILRSTSLPSTEKEETLPKNIKKTKKEVVTLENGCICCTLRGDLIREIYRIQQSGEFDNILIESTGIAEPQQVAESFCVDPETMQHSKADLRDENGDMIDSKSLWNSARLDACVTLVDAVNFPKYMSSLNRFKDIFRDGLTESEQAEGQKSISELMVEQVEFANVIVLNKVDLVSEEQIETAKTLIRSLNPTATVIPAVHGKIDLKFILDTGLFSMEGAEKSRGWLESMRDGITLSHGESDEYGVTSFVYRTRAPFHPLRLHTFLQKLFVFAEDWNTETKILSSVSTLSEVSNSENAKKYGSILRSKGTCWIAGRDEHQITWHQSGPIIQLTPTSAWYCRKDPEKWDVEDEEETDRIDSLFTYEINGKMVPYKYGDRRQELVFIGVKLQQKVIEDDLQHCLLTDDEMGQHACDLPLGTYPDPLLPILIPCIGAHSLFVIARPNQNQHVRIFEGFALTLQHIVLNITSEEPNIRAVKVWLDKSDLHRQVGVLLATLRPETHENHSLSLSLLACDDEGGEEVTNRRLRVELIPKDSRTQLSSLDLLMSCEVHIMGKIEPLQYSPDRGNNDDADADGHVEEEEEEAHGSEEDCEDGMCDYS